MYSLNLNFTNADFSMYLVDLKEEVYVTVNRMTVSEKKQLVCTGDIQYFEQDFSHMPQ